MQLFTFTVFNLDLSAPPSLSQSVHFLLPSSSGASLPREPVCLILAGCAKTGSEGPARRRFSLWRNSLQGRELPRGRALRLPVLHNLVPNVTFICLFIYQDCTNDWLSLRFLPLFFLPFPLTLHEMGPVTGSPSVIPVPPTSCLVNQ